MSLTSAMIFAAGFGTRMGEMTQTMPKPMLPIGGRPMIDHSIDLLRAAGITKLVANTHYLPEKLGEHLTAQNVRVLHEPVILDTGGGLKAALPAIGENPVVTMNPDAFWVGPNPVSQLIGAWKSDMQACLLLAKAPPGQAADFDLTRGEIRRNGGYRYTGLQIINTSRLNEITDENFSLNLYWDLLAERSPIHGVVYDGNWLDIGTAEKLELARNGLAK